MPALCDLGVRWEDRLRPLPHGDRVSDKPYSPIGALKRTRRAMDTVSAKHRPPADTPLSLATTSGPIPCAVLLRSLVERGPVPDDFQGLTNAAAIKEHVRPDGASFIGAYELQGDRGSVVLVYGPKTLDMIAAEKLATMERPALIARHETAKLGPFAAKPLGAA